MGSSSAEECEILTLCAAVKMKVIVILMALGFLATSVNADACKHCLNKLCTPCVPLSTPYPMDSEVQTLYTSEL